MGNLPPADGDGAHEDGSEVGPGEQLTGDVHLW